MSVYAIPIGVSFLVATQLTPRIYETSTKYKELVNRFNQMNTFYRSQSDWTFHSVLSLTALACGSAAPLIQEGHSGPIMDFTALRSARNKFTKEFPSHLGNESPKWVASAFTAAAIAQMIICYRKPLSAFTRLLTLTVTIATPLIFFLKENQAQVVYTKIRSAVARYAYSYPVATSSGITHFVFNNEPYESIVGKFATKDISLIVKGLRDNTLPEVFNNFAQA